MSIYAVEDKIESFEIGPDVIAELEAGILTVRGYGDTDDFTAETAPFSGYEDEIHTLVIEDGITYIGSCLFYGLGGLQGELELPGSIVGFGDYAFSGESRDRAPQFTVIRNEFEGVEAVERNATSSQAQKQEPSETETVPAETPVDSGEGLVETEEETERGSEEALLPSEGGTASENRDEMPESETASSVAETEENSGSGTDGDEGPDCFGHIFRSLESEVFDRFIEDFIFFGIYILTFIKRGIIIFDV